MGLSGSDTKRIVSAVAATVVALAAGTNVRDRSSEGESVLVVRERSGLLTVGNSMRTLHGHRSSESR